MNVQRFISEANWNYCAVALLEDVSYFLINELN